MLEYRVKDLAFWGVGLGGSGLGFKDSRQAIVKVKSLEVLMSGVLKKDIFNHWCC